MNNPLHILQTLDRHLTKPAEIAIFGRAALALGFAAEDENMDFWQAQQKTNTELAPAFTHARVPDVPEIHELFQIAQAKVLAMLPSEG